MTALSHIQYFLGANSPTGFYSLYDHLLSPEEARAIYILKGGPGCGKSTLMLETEYILCSGDPDSLDAVILPAVGAAIVDGTAPQGVVPQGHNGGFVPLLERKGTEQNFGEKLRFSSWTQSLVHRTAI